MIFCTIMMVSLVTVATMCALVITPEDKIYTHCHMVYLKKNIVQEKKYIMRIRDRISLRNIV